MQGCLVVSWEKLDLYIWPVMIAHAESAAIIAVVSTIDGTFFAMLAGTLSAWHMFTDLLETLATTEPGTAVVGRLVAGWACTDRIRHAG